MLRVLVVDDSVVFRSQIKSSLEGAANIEVAGVANNGRVALQKLTQMSVDVVTLDMEMPELNGIETIKEIKKAKFPVKIVVFSSHTSRGSEATLEALAAGADDFIAKPSGPDVTFENSVQKIRDELLPKISQFVGRVGTTAKVAPMTTTTTASAVKSAYPKRDLATFFPSVIVIGSSTGGPPALEKALMGLNHNPRVPILIAQHMPPMFTASLAKRLQETTGIPCAEAKHGEVLKPGRIYIAPGDYHMTLVKAGTEVKLNLDQGPQRNSVRPAVDPLFETATAIFGSRTLGVILTGMGEDGFVGSRAVKEGGGGVLIQDKESCVVFGMPGAVFQGQLQDGMGDLTFVNSILKRVVA